MSTKATRKFQRYREGSARKRNQKNLSDDHIGESKKRYRVCLNLHCLCTLSHTQPLLFLLTCFIFTAGQFNKEGKFFGHMAMPITLHTFSFQTSYLLAFFLLQGEFLKFYSTNRDEEIKKKVFFSHGEFLISLNWLQMVWNRLKLKQMN